MFHQRRVARAVCNLLHRYTELRRAHLCHAGGVTLAVGRGADRQPDLPIVAQLGTCTLAIHPGGLEKERYAHTAISAAPPLLLLRPLDPLIINEISGAPET